MKHLLSVLVVSVIFVFSATAQPQVPQGAPQGPRPNMQRPNVAPASDLNAMHAPILPFRKTIVDKVAYNAYEESNSYAKDVEVVFLGDSITENWYTFHHDFFDKNNFAARGIGGQTSITILCRFHQDVVNLHPKVAVVMCGTNDIAQNDGEMEYDDFLDNIAAMCDQAKANGIKFLLCSIPPCDKFSWNQEAVPGPEVIKVNEMLKKYAKEAGIQYVDFFSVLSNGKDGMIDEYTSDRCHPTPLGYNVMERFVVKEINKALGTNVDYFVTPEK